MPRVLMGQQDLTFADGVIKPVEYERLGARVWVFGALMVITALVTLFLILQEFTSRSYLYLAFYSIPANTGISVFPHEPVLLYFGSQGSILLTAAWAALGTVVAGYLDHSVFVPVMNLKSLKGYKEKGWYRKLAGLFMRFPFVTLLVTAFTPIPFFPFKFLSFSVHYPLWRYLAALVTARFPRYVIYAWVGSLFYIPKWLVFAFCGVIGVVYAVKGIQEAVRHARGARSRPSRGEAAAGADAVAPVGDSSRR